MKTPPRFEQRKQAGVAIVLVLSILVLLTVVVVAFFTSASSDLIVSKGYSDEVRVRLLGDSAVNLVEGQLRAATQGAADPTQPAGGGNPPLAWASQPGMVRTYDNAGLPVTAYKLYSADPLQVAGAYSPTAALSSEIPTDWNTTPSDYVDLNSPSLVLDPNGTVVDPNDTTVKYSARYPIVDGNNLVKGLKLMPTAGDPTATLLGYDSNGDGSSDIDGFSVQLPPTYDVKKVVAPNNNPVPMPVRWLYVLQDGQLHARVTAAAATAGGPVGSIPGASATNPVVGRIAYWTDDDTCKLNVNTASEGTYWSPPRARSSKEGQYSLNVPGQNEFQMFSGHPAKTCLSSVFNSIWPVPDAVNSAGVFVPLTAGNYTQLLPYYDLVPRVTDGLRTTSGGQAQGSAGGTRAAKATTGIAYDADRLYASVDEIMFNTKPDPSNARTPRNSTANIPGAANPITPQFLETTRFFLTATNRAPEVNLLNTPRIALWPLQVGQSFRTGKEKLIAFCSTVPSVPTDPSGAPLVAGTPQYPYYFQRLSATTQQNGFASGLSSESPTDDFDPSKKMVRNNQLYHYLQNLTQADVPGLGGHFAGKYPSTDQILTEMVDQVRSGLNTWTTGDGSNTAYTYAEPTGGAGEREVVPLLNPAGTTTKGFGRYSTITEAAIDLFRCNDPNAVVRDPETGKPNPKPFPIQIGAVLIMQPFTPSPGFPSFTSAMQIEVDGLNGFTIQDSRGASPIVNLGLPGGTPTTINATVNNFVAIGSTTEFNTLSGFFASGNTAKTVDVPVAPQYPFFNLPDQIPDPNANPNGPIKLGVAQLPSDSTHFNFNAGGTATITIKIYTNGAPRQLLQTLTMDFPTSTGLPVPRYTTRNMVDPPNGKTFPTTARILKYRLTPVGNNNGEHSQNLPVRPGLAQDNEPSDPGFSDNALPSNPNNQAGHVASGHGLIDREDVVRSVVVKSSVGSPSLGDYRVIAGLQNIPREFFTPHPFYTLAFPTSPPQATASDPNPSAYADNWRFADSLRSGDNPGWGGIGYYNYGGGAENTPNTDPYLTPITNTTVEASPRGSGITPILLRKPAFNGPLIPRSLLLGAPSDPKLPLYAPEAAPAVPAGMTQGALMQNPVSGSYDIAGDWDTGYGNLEDGPYINKPDEAASGNYGGPFAQAANETSIYFGRTIAGNDTGETYSPNRQVSSGVIFGSLPTGIDPSGSATTQKPWQTLLFCANPAMGVPAVSTTGAALPAGVQHPGFGKSTIIAPDGVPSPPYTVVPDHYLLDLFTMPIVEPYALSEPLSTQGKVNMNYQMAPFTYIQRDTALRAVLRGTRLTAIASSPTMLATYKSVNLPPGATSPTPSAPIRFPINPDETTGTLKAFEDRFNGSGGVSGDIFRSASEICSVPLIPSYAPDLTQPKPQPYDPVIKQSDMTAARIQNFWRNCQLTGDNLREEPYGDLYARLTTKSNTYTVHVRVQTLKKVLGTNQATFVDPTEKTTGAKDVITAEYRGSYQIERYVDPNVSTASTDPNKPAFPDYATVMDAHGYAPLISKYYKFHTVGTKEF